MKIYIITITTMIDGEQNREVFKKAFRTKESTKDVMNSFYEDWMSKAKSYIKFSGYIARYWGGDYFFIYNLFKPETFTVDCSIDEVELPDEDND